MSWIFLKILADMLSAGNSLTVKKMLSERVSDQRLYLFSAGIVSLPFAGIGLKYLMTTNSGVHTCIALFSGIMYVLTRRFYCQAMAVEQASRLSLLLRTRIVSILFFSIVLLQKQFTMLQYIGCCLSIVGGLVISFEQVKHRPSFGRGVQAALMCNICSSLGFVSKVYLLQHYTFWETFSMLRVGMVVGVILILKLRGILESGHVLLTLSLHSRGMLIVEQSIELIFALLNTLVYSKADSAVMMSVLSGFQPLYVKLMEIWTNHVREGDTGLWRGAIAFTMFLGSAYLMAH